VGFQGVRFAESVPDFSEVIASTGRYAVRGILFDTDSDRIQPESAPAIRQIARVLDANAALTLLLIEGHTDAVGDASHNLDLSKRRAEAVRAALVAQSNIDSARLGTAGLGGAKACRIERHPQGRARTPCRAGQDVAPETPGTLNVLNAEAPLEQPRLHSTRMI
jgi:outer membrane protein OmpA-like peptidoglycan-associated protein